jgi:hypothetical protein
MSLGEIKRSDRLRGAFHLLRLIPVLEVLRSPLRPACEAVVRWGTTEGEVLADGILIALDDYREAAREADPGYTSSVYYDNSIALLALHTAGAASINGNPRGEIIVRVAEGIWQRISERIDNLARPGFDSWDTAPDEIQRMLDSTQDDASGLVARERAWWSQDEHVIRDDLANLNAVSLYLAELGKFAEGSRAELAHIFDSLDVSSHGPCGTQCDWPACATDLKTCVRNREYQPHLSLAATLRRRNGAEPRPWYVRVLAYDPPPGEPCDFLIEIGADGYEKRKVGIHADERREWCGDGRESQVLRLSSHPITSLAVYEERVDMMAEEIAPSLFARYWDPDRNASVRASE